MKFKVSALILSCISFGLWADYNPYRFFFVAYQYPCLPLSVHYTQEQKFYGSDLDYLMHAYSIFTPAYLEKENGLRHYIRRMSIYVYKQKNEDSYYFDYTIDLMYPYDSLKNETLKLSKEAAMAFFAKVPAVELPKTMGKYEHYKLANAFSIDALPKEPNMNVFTAIIDLLNAMGIPVKFDMNDITAKFGFRKKWLSLETWDRWLD